MIAVQALWAGPWLTRVAGWSAGQAAEGLFLINLAMLCTFAAWGALMPRLVQGGWTAPRIMRRGIPVALALLLLNILLGPAAGAAHWSVWCMACTAVSVSQPAASPGPDRGGGLPRRDGRAAGLLHAGLRVVRARHAAHRRGCG
jgi:hypothetical protein